MNQFIEDVSNWEGNEIAEETQARLLGQNGFEVAPSPCMALFLARRSVHAPSLIAAQAMFAAKCDSRRD